MLDVDTCMALKDLGLERDHRTEKTPGSARQVTLISEEFIEQIRLFTGHAQLPPSWLRRNLVCRGINLNALRYQQFSIGDAIFEANALCHPCSRMEKTLGKGGLVAMLGHGGLCCKILKTGRISINDEIRVMAPQQDLF
ncbi:Uncharacterised protein [BD1-7 clade bacterium]|uniref:MOSC domain-containing protein n=1 Tax=BD1-7 clade bacterium TaxID=2029982 RepID=A0A5S9PHQ1_9GAMM|nr:Uncharacterised protein [BD1-7 clade bacterium]CAA0103735.1 Uncharacterised protein [BD1-7 clade bacterium]